MFFATTGAVLEVTDIALAPMVIDGWRARVLRARSHLGWPELPLAVRPLGLRPQSGASQAIGASLALAAPSDQLFLATEINEWALCATLAEREPSSWSGVEEALRVAAIEETPEIATIDPPVLEESAALARFSRQAAREARPDLRALIDIANDRQLPVILDETTLTLGAGIGGRSFALAALPYPPDIPWKDLHDIPTALVTGSNGKTTSVRLIAACARAHGWCSGYNCTEGVFIGTDILAKGDYAGPAGARLVMRDQRTEAAILEVARGGILRRGIAVTQAQVALVTNISADHFGEYGIEDLDGLADVKLSVARLLGPDGILILNADDAVLREKSAELAARFANSRFDTVRSLAWFALDNDYPTLRDHRARGGATCGVRAGRLILSREGQYDLGNIDTMPLSVGGFAEYNIANLAGAALAAAALKISPAHIAQVYARFGADPSDNAGRMMRFDFKGAQVLVDYAHNPDGLAGLLKVAKKMCAERGRLGLILGHAGNRQNADIEALARVAAENHPDLVVIKENEAFLRGRPPGEIPRIIRDELIRSGLTESAILMAVSEMESVRVALDWARAGDVLALPIHGSAARADVLALFGVRI